MPELKYKQSKSKHESMKEMGLGSRSKRLEKMFDKIHLSREKKAGETVIYDRFPEIKSTYEMVEGKIVETKKTICELPKGTILTLLEDCTDGEYGVYVTDKGTFFPRNFNMVTPDMENSDHSLYNEAKKRGYIK